MKTLGKRYLVLALLVIFCFSVFPVRSSAEADWAILYREKIDQILSEYRSGDRDTKDFALFFQVQDIDLDGVPELYHAIINTFEMYYSPLEEAEEIYYIKNGAVQQGSIAPHETLGLMPATQPYEGDRGQYVMRSVNGELLYVTQDCDIKLGDEHYILYQALDFDNSTGILSVRELLFDSWTDETDPNHTTAVFSGYDILAHSTSAWFSSWELEGVSADAMSELWGWSPPSLGVGVPSDAVQLRSFTDAKPLVDQMMYYGDTAQCQMTIPQALGFAQLIRNVPGSHIKAALFDGGGGIPLIWIAHGDGWEEQTQALTGDYGDSIYYWDGAAARENPEWMTTLLYPGEQGVMVRLSLSRYNDTETYQFYNLSGGRIMSEPFSRGTYEPSTGYILNGNPVPVNSRMDYYRYVFSASDVFLQAESDLGEKLYLVGSWQDGYSLAALLENYAQCLSQPVEMTTAPPQPESTESASDSSREDDPAATAPQSVAAQEPETEQDETIQQTVPIQQEEPESGLSIFVMALIIGIILIILVIAILLMILLRRRTRQ